MSYFGVSNPELDAPLSGMRAARRGRARAQRKRVSHSQMAGRNGGFADPREIMAYHNKGELSDAATIQALSLFGIGSIRAKGMLGGSHRARQQSAMMGARRQQAAFRSMGNGGGNGSGPTKRYFAANDRNGGNWQIELEYVGQHVGMGQLTKWRVRSLDGVVQAWMKSGSEMNASLAKQAAQTAIESLVEDVQDQDFVVDEFGENFQDALGNFWAIRYSTQYTGGVITWVNWSVSSVTLNLSYTGQAETKAAGRIAALNAVEAWVAVQQVDNDGDGDATGDGNGSDSNGNGSDSNGNGSNFSQTFTFNHPGLGSASGIGPSVWTIVATLTADNWNYTASSPNWDFPVNADRNYFSADAARMGAEDRINNSIMAAGGYTGGNGGETGGNGGETGGNGAETGGNGGETGGNGNGNGAETGGNGVSTSDLSDYTSAQDVIDGRKLGVISYLDAFNTLVNQFFWTEEQAKEALRTESSSNDYYVPDNIDVTVTPPESRDNNQPVQIQTQEIERQVVPMDTGFNMPSTPILVGGAILVAGVTAVAYTSRRN